MREDLIVDVAVNETPITAEVIAARVARGAAYLDATYPGWWDRITLDRLDLKSCYSCVVGQLAMQRHPTVVYTFSDALASLGLDAAQGRLCGFLYLYPDMWGVSHQRGVWDDLQDTWVAAIRARRASAPVEDRELVEV